MVVEAQVVRQVLMGLSRRLYRLPAQVLPLQRTEEALRHRVVPAVSLPAHALDHAVLGQRLSVAPTRVGTSTIRVVDEPLPQASTARCHPQSPEGKVGIVRLAR